MDGVDTALVEISDEHVRLVAHDDYPMPTALKEMLLSVCTGQATNLKAIGELDHQLGHLFADAVLQLLNKSGCVAEQIRAIGCRYLLEGSRARIYGGLLRPRAHHREFLGRFRLDPALALV